ncbi:DUF2271 domain-containing protein [Paraglaciecola sp. 2405UD69-4]|uniref:DUF2271 domain-containing protein n=1 Tax=Paraglaciecola sp. 2405UD69-4 TaxID=3391836 RepID=UPI0039C9C553
MKKLLPALALVLPSFLGQASSLTLDIEIPQLDVAEYHAPYVAVWLQSKDRKQLTNLALWYDLEMKNGKGEEWLKDIRQWWRHSGRSLEFPVDGFSGATRKAGKYSLSFDKSQLDLDSLPDGEYRILVEAVREVGGREMLKLPLTLPITSNQDLSVQGKKELGKVTASLAP